MRITYYDNAGRKAMAFYYDNFIVDVQKAGGLPRAPLPSDLFVPESCQQLRQIYEDITSEPALLLRQPLDEVTLLPLISSDFNSVFFVGRNFKTVYKEMNTATNKDTPQLERPAFFYKLNRSIIQSGEQIVANHAETRQLDYEGEIGIVIGKKGKDIPIAAAGDYVFGYTICNDISARDAMKAYYQMFKGKSFDTFCPVGPCIATRDSVAEPIFIQTTVNGELRQAGDTSDLVFDFATIIHYLSRGLTLYPGDIISTGTPGGIGAAMNPPQFLQQDDVVEVMVSDVGILRTPISFY